MFERSETSRVQRHFTKHSIGSQPRRLTVKSCFFLFFLSLFFLSACVESSSDRISIEKESISENTQNDTNNELDDDISDDLDWYEYLDNYKPLQGPCEGPQTPPEPYYSYETSWIMATFDNPNIPFHGLYAYFWIDWFLFDGCSYSSVFSVLYLKSGKIHNIRSSGGLFSGLDIHYFDEPEYHIFVFPYMRIKVDPKNPFLFHLDIYGNGYDVHLEVKITHTRLWTPQWYAFYDAEVTRAKINIDHQCFSTTGKAILERWYSVGGTDPADADFLNGYWLYESIFWTSDDGDEVATLFYYWVGTDGNETAIIMQEGILSKGLTQYHSYKITPDYNFNENTDSKGYLRKHSLFAEFITGEDLYYQVEVQKEYMDTHIVFWDRIILGEDSGFLESHSYVTGTMEFQGKIYTGRGYFEWKSTTLNPLDDIDVPDKS